MARGGDDLVGHRLVTAREDEDLARLLVAGLDHVDRVAQHRRNDEAVDDRVDAHVAHEQRREDDHRVDGHHDAAVADRLVLVDDHGDDVRAARRAALPEADGDADAGDDAAQDDQQDAVADGIEREERLPGRRNGGQQRLQHRHRDREHGDAEDGLHAEVPPHDRAADEQQHAVDDERQHADG